MSHLSFQVNLEDEDGILKVWEMLGRYLNRDKAETDTECCDVKDDATAPPPPDEEADVELDSAGEPWDEEKHSATKSKLKDGTWRPRRNSKTKEDKPVPPPPADDAAMAPEEINYKQMMEILKGKQLTLPEMNELAKSVGVDSIGLLISHPELIPAVLALAADR